MSNQLQEILSSKTKGKVKFFNQDKGFGFIETSIGDHFFHVSGYRVPSRRYFSIVFIRNSVRNSEPDVKIGSEVVILASRDSDKGRQAIEWLLSPPQVAPLYCVIRRTEEQIASQPVVDNTIRMWKSATKITIIERVIFIGNKADCEELVSGAHIPGTYRVVELNDDNRGYVSNTE